MQINQWWPFINYLLLIKVLRKRYIYILITCQQMTKSVLIIFVLSAWYIRVDVCNTYVKNYSLIDPDLLEL